MTKICTTIEQSKKLLKLGIDVNTADMRYGYIAPYDYSDRMFDGGYDEVPYPKDFLKRNPNFSENEYDGELPAWSLTSLLGLMPDRLYINDDEVYWFELDNVGGLYRCYYEDEEDYDLSFFDGEEPIDVLFNMVVWLKENNKI